MDAFHSLATPLQILLVDLLLGADNALLIGLASRALPPRERTRAAALGIAGAFVLRLLLTMVATSLLTWPLVKLVGAAVLTIIALNLAEEDRDETETPEAENGASARLWRAAAIIVVADVAMSIDNVVALAAIAQGNFLWLSLGVALSLPLLGYGGLVVAQTLHRAPGLAAFGAVLLGWIAGGMAVSDGLWSSWVEANAPGLAVLAPALGAAFVYFHLRLISRPVRAPARTLRVPPPPAAPAPAVPPVAKPNAAPPREAKDAPNPNERVMLAGMALLLLIAGGLLAVAAYFGGLE